MADRQYLFNYRFAGSSWGITIYARDQAEACEKIKAVAWAQYKGEVKALIPIPGGTLIERLIAWWRRR